MQNEGYKGLTGLEGEKPCKKNGRKWKKNLDWSLDWSDRERKCLKTFEKVFEHVRIKCFKKLSIWFSINQKLGSIDRKCFDWSSINRASIETDRDWPKFLIAILIDQKIGSINRNYD